MTLSFVLRKLNGGGPSQVKGVIRVLRAHNQIETICSLWQRSADRERVAVRTA